eukprot:CAMPEP_0114389548 /NCGR_PEP_ID=MMETSP0102-20121206/8743_1 /TAXON_ID=38822 ORGANISM="Pteridomonas danica, Strain PT" /NCGR_SAMPLE_ID=MMETSP0102 /ASSEMBLY_ACC=CAM_ASM_000212 /LENGTH=222 /DNA_ID=CAMNT_0001547507 /DNA_START=43 /DNA_END=712 /DNA_ORIENTATION=+
MDLDRELSTNRKADEGNGGGRKRGDSNKKNSLKAMDLDRELSTNRKADEGNGGGRKRGDSNKKRRTGADSGASEEKEVTVVIPNEFIGSLIGTSGRGIRRLQYQAHTTIKCSGPDDFFPGTKSRKVTLLNESIASLDAALSLICLVVAQDYPEKFREIAIVIPESEAGRMIGKGGATIQTFRDNCEHCELTDAENGERLLVIYGDILQMTKTARMALECLLK